MDAKRTLPILLLVALAGLAWWLVDGRQADPPGAAVAVAQPDLSVGSSAQPTGATQRHAAAPVRQIKGAQPSESASTKVTPPPAKAPSITTKRPPSKAAPASTRSARTKPVVVATNGDRGPPQAIVERAVVKSHGRTVHRGRVDLTKTIARIKAGVKHRHRNDGSVFRNREKRLPRQRRGYYREYVHPTEGVRGAGPQRIVVGQGGDWYYTGDHYGTFVPLN